MTEKEERAAAELEYSTSAFDYVRDPIGSERWCQFWKGWQAACTAKDAEIAALRQDAAAARRVLEEMAALRQDAERYRWLRDNRSSSWAICEWQDDVEEYYRDGRDKDTVDAAIDAALAQAAAR